ncbi:MAG TPA: Gfo/Idh/MocA family oxidoreductase [Opitutaceae bacterium]|nr:Gfo/Idh/MocA family oxidoreductase [Opitutaceae bacterium]
MSSSEQKIRWGVLGYAKIAREMVMPAIQRSSNSVLHALASRDGAKLAEARAKFALPRSFASYDALLGDADVDAVYLPLPNSLHREWTLAAAQHGKHVLCEKPLALHAAEAREMVAACRQHGVLLMEAFMYRYTARTRAVLDVVRSGALGEIRQINSTFRFLLANPASIKLKPDLGGGALYDVGCYPVNFIGMIVDAIAGGAPGAGGQPDSIAVESLQKDGVDLGFSALLRYASGAMATLNCGFNAHKRVYSEIIGTEAVLEIPDTFFDNAGALTVITGEQRREIPVPASDRYRLEVEDFADAIRHARDPQFSLVETLRNAELMDRLFAAAKAST